MNAIFSFKIFGSADVLIETGFFELAKLAVKSASKFYKTKFYTDSETNIIFQQMGVKFDEVVISKNIQNYKGYMFTAPKIFAMIEESEPFVHLDFDVYTNCKYRTNKQIGFGYPDYNFKGDLLVPIAMMDYVSGVYLNPFNLYLKKYFKEDFYYSWDWGSCPNTSVTIINNPHIINSLYTDIIDTIEELFYSEKNYPGTAVLVDQFLLGRYLDEYHIDYDYIFDRNRFYINSNEDSIILSKDVRFLKKNKIQYLLKMYPFVHFQGYKNNKVVVASIIDGVLNETNF